MFMYYSKCDPLSAGWVEKSDQLIPYLILDIFEKQPGLAGLYIASIFSGTLSTVSSGINSMATITVLDLVRPCFQVNSNVEAIITKALVFVYGLR